MDLHRRFPTGGFACASIGETVRVSGHGSSNQYLMPDEDSELALARSSRSATMRSLRVRRESLDRSVFINTQGPREHADYFRLARTGLPRAKDVCSRRRLPEMKRLRYSVGATPNRWTNARRKLSGSRKPTESAMFSIV